MPSVSRIRDDAVVAQRSSVPLGPLPGTPEGKEAPDRLVPRSGYEGRPLHPEGAVARVRTLRPSRLEGTE